MEKVRLWSPKQSNVWLCCHGKVGFKFVGSSLALSFFPHHSEFISDFSTLSHACYKTFTIVIWYRGRQFSSKKLTGLFIADGPPLRRSSFFMYCEIESIYRCWVCKESVWQSLRILVQRDISYPVDQWKLFLVLPRTAKNAFLCSFYLIAFIVLFKTSLLAVKLGGN